MGELSGICNLDGRLQPVDLVELRQAYVRSSHDSAVLSHPGGSSIAGDDFTGRAKGRLCHVDGRFDNAETLAEGLGLRSGSWNNADLALALFHRRGPQGLLEILGDWSLALWDPQDRYLILASDYAGNRPLYYSRCKDRVFWGTSLSALARRTQATTLDRDFVIQTLAQGVAKERTPYDGIRSVPAGGVLQISSRGVQIVADWHPPVDRETRFSDEDAYGERLFELLQDAVAVRAKGQSEICAELSGGLDSSSIVCMLKHLQSRGALPNTNVVTISYHTEGSSDERFGRIVERACSFAHHHVPLDDHGFIGAADCGDARPAWWAPRHAHVAQIMQRLNASVLLSGQMGDLIMGNWFDGWEQVSHHIRDGAFKTAFGLAMEWSAVQGTPVYPLLWRALTNRSSLGGDAEETET